MVLGWEILYMYVRGVEHSNVHFWGSGLKRDDRANVNGGKL